jgi:arylsulfatase A-like enzyme
MRLAAGRIVFGVLLAAAGGFGSASAEPPQNVVFLLVDDLGWTDLGCYGSDFYETPRVDQLAARGLRFTQAYAAAPVCSPTRAAILTGKFPARLGMTIWHEGAVGGGPTNRPLRDAPSTPNLPHDEVTLAERFQEAGYFTAHVGKWHLGKAAWYPETQGYEVNVGGTFWGAPSTYFHPFRGPWSRTDPELRYVPGLGPGAEGDYLTDRLTDAALELMAAADGRPFFLSLWFHTVHTPIEGKPELVERYRARAQGQRHGHASYAAMVHSMDQNVGRVLDKLDELQLTERTVVILTSDNGGVDFETRSGIPTSNAPLRSGKGTLYEGGIRVPLLVCWPGRTRPGAVCHQLVSSQDFSPTLREGFGLGTGRSDEVDGISFHLQLAEPAAPLDREALYWHYPHYYPRMTPASAVRHNNWKLIHYYEDDHLELYDVGQDLAEQRDLSGQQPERAAALRSRLDEWRRAVGARQPRPNPDFRASPAVR